METNRGLFEAQTANKSLTRADLGQFCEVQRWLESKKESTKHVYLHALIAFTEYTKLNPKELIDLAEEDLKKSQRERGEPSRKVLAFYNWLTNGYTRRLHRKDQNNKQLSRNLANTYSQAIKGFFGDNGFPLSVRIPKPIGRKENFNPEPPRIPEVKRLIDATTCLRDKAIILTLFQSGMSLNELCHLTYGDVARGLERNEEPLYLHIIRQKTDTEYETFIGLDAIQAIKAYLAQRTRDNEILKNSTPLFTPLFTTDRKSSNVKKLCPALIDAFFRRAAEESGLVTQEKLQTADMNPYRPHSLRAAFISILKLAGYSQ